MVYLTDYYNEYFRGVRSFKLPYLTNLRLNEAIYLSWPFVVLNAVYALLMSVIMNQGVVSKLNIILILSWSGLGAIIFPLTSYFYYFFWKLALGLYFGALDMDSYKADRIISTSFSSYSLLAIPLIGALLQRMFQAYLMYKNIKFELSLTPFQTVLVMITPLLIQFFLFFSSILSLFLVVLMVFKF